MTPRGRLRALLASACLLAAAGCTASVPPPTSPTAPAAPDAVLADISLAVDGEPVSGGWLTTGLCTRTEAGLTFAAAGADSSISGELASGGQLRLERMAYTERVRTYLATGPGTIHADGDTFTIASTVDLPDGGDPHDLTVAVSCPA